MQLTHGYRGYLGPFVSAPRSGRRWVRYRETAVKWLGQSQAVMPEKHGKEESYELGFKGSSQLDE